MQFLPREKEVKEEIAFGTTRSQSAGTEGKQSIKLTLTHLPTLDRLEEPVTAANTRLEGLRDCGATLLVVAGRVLGVTIHIVKNAKITQRPEIVLTQTSQLVLEVSPLSFEICELPKVQVLSIADCFCRIDELLAADHADAVVAVILVQLEGVMRSYKGEEALGTSQDADERSTRVLRVPRLKAPNEPGVEGVVAGSVSDVRDPRQKLPVQGGARRKNAQMIEAANRRRR
jgi:hypothetical protein